MQQPEADATMQDDESNWEDIQDPNIPMDSEITLTAEGDEADVLREYSGVYVSCYYPSLVDTVTNMSILGPDIGLIIVLGANAFALGTLNGWSSSTLSLMLIFRGKLTCPIWRMPEHRSL